MSKTGQIRWGEAGIFLGLPEVPMSESQVQDSIVQARLAAAQELLERKASDRAKADAEIAALEKVKAEAKRTGSVFPEKGAQRLAALKAWFPPSTPLDADLR
jgi:hypothetical protein